MYHQYVNFTQFYVTVGVNLVITLRGYQLDIAIQLPSVLKNTGIQGLMGNFNDDPNDDLISSGGVMISANSTEETIHYDFGETCELFVIGITFCMLQAIQVK